MLYAAKDFTMVGLTFKKGDAVDPSKFEPDVLPGMVSAGFVDDGTVKSAPAKKVKEVTEPVEEKKPVKETKK